MPANADDTSLESWLTAQQEAWPDGVLMLSAAPEHRILRYNRHFQELWALSEEALRDDQRLVVEILSQVADPSEVERHFRAAKKQPAEPHRFRIVHEDGRSFDVRIQPVVSSSGELFARLFIFRDISNHLLAARELHESEERYRLLVEHSPDMVAVHVRGRFVFLNAAGARMLGAATPEELYGRRVLDFVHPDYVPQVEARVRDMTDRAQLAPLLEERFVALDGSQIDVEVIGVPITFEGMPGVQVIARNISKRKRAEALVRHMATEDSLTGLPNRHLFHERLHHALSQAHHRSRCLAILFLDLDRFKNINDTLGHEIGDRLLQLIAERLQGCLKSGDFCARIGGDEFSIILPHIQDSQEAAAVAHRIQQALAEPFTVPGHELYVTASIGITQYPADGEEPSHLIKNADTAMYRAKAERNTYRIYSPTMNETALERLSLESLLHKAIERDEFIIHYQPQVDLHSGSIVGAEALIRWHQPELGLISPAKFIPLAEETGLIMPITDLVLRKACHQVKEWHRAGTPVRRMAVNLSGLYFKQREVTQAIADVLAEYDLPASCLELELTESIFMEDRDTTLTTLRTLRAMGVRVSIDDFGTGYSSLSYLQRFPIGMLKIDQSFVREISSASDDAAIVQTIILLAHSLGMRVIAEGVETEEQRAFLTALGCDEIQGYLISRPVSAEHFQRLLRADAEAAAS
ncbi:MAG TPA: EAL domain-containing protein [Stenomitos sp.]